MPWTHCLGKESEDVMERLTEKALGCFQFTLKDHKPKPGEFADYDAFFDYHVAVKRLGEYEDTGLTPEQVKTLAEAKAIYEAYDGSKLDKADQYIEQLEQAIDRLKKENEELLRLVDADGEIDYHPSDYHNPADTDRIEKLQNDNQMLLNTQLHLGKRLQVLVEDKDEQAGRIMRMEIALKDAEEALKLLHPSMNPDEPCFTYETWKAINALLGGVEG